MTQVYEEGVAIDVSRFGHSVVRRERTALATRIFAAGFLLRRRVAL